jgi:hypothetical protein
MEYCKPGTKGPEVVVPWARFVNLGVNATTRAWMTRRGLGALSGEGVTMGPDGCAVEAFLRHPYEDWTAFYTHHERTYTNPHVTLVGELFRKTVEAKAAYRLGDPDWLGEAARRLAALHIRWYGYPRAGRKVDEILKNLGT